MVVVNCLRQKQVGIAESACSALDTHWDGVDIQRGGTNTWKKSFIHSHLKQILCVSFDVSAPLADNKTHLEKKAQSSPQVARTSAAGAQRVTWSVSESHPPFSLFPTQPCCIVNAQSEKRGALLFIVLFLLQIHQMVKRQNHIRLPKAHSYILSFLGSWRGKFQFKFLLRNAQEGDHEANFHPRGKVYCSR